MKRVFFISVALMFFAGMFLAQGRPAQGATKIMPGTIIPVELAKTLDAKKVKAGDKIEVKIVTDLLSDGVVIIRKGAKMTGHISDANVRNRDSKNSMVGIVFDRLFTKDGGELAIQATIQAVGPSVENGPISSSMAARPLGSSGASIPGGGTGRSSGDSGPCQGVVGMRGLSLNTSGPASVVSSSNENVHRRAEPS